MLFSQNLKNCNEFVKKMYHDKNVEMIIQLSADENPYIIWIFKIARSNWLQNFMNLTGIWIQVTIHQFFNPKHQIQYIK